VIGGFQVGPFQLAYQQGVPVGIPIGRPHRKGYGYQPAFIPNLREEPELVKPSKAEPRPVAPSYVEVPIHVSLELGSAVDSFFEVSVASVIGLPAARAFVDGFMEASAPFTASVIGMQSSADVDWSFIGQVQTGMVLGSEVDSDLDEARRRPISDGDALDILSKLV